MPPGANPRPSSSIRAVTAPALRANTMLTALGLSMFDDVGQRLLDDAIEGGLDVGWQPVADLRLEIDAHPGLLGEGVA